MELKNLLVKERVITVEYPDSDLEGFTVDLAYLPREELQKIRKKCIKTRYSKKSHQPEEELDDSLFLKLYVGAMIEGWKGLKLGYLKELMTVDLGSAKEDMLLEYSEDNALELMKNSTIFDTWISGVVSDVTSFNKNS